MCRICSRHERQELQSTLDRKPERERSLERLRHKWKDNIKMDIINRVWGDKIYLYDLGWDPAMSSWKHSDELSMFSKSHAVSWPTDQLSSFQEGLSQWSWHSYSLCYWRAIFDKRNITHYLQVLCKV